MKAIVIRTIFLAVSWLILIGKAVISVCSNLKDI